jgi:hypothetical protein
VLDLMSFAPSFRRQLLFGISVALNAAIFQFLIAALLGTFVNEGEAAEGVGLMWFATLPATLVLGLLSSFAFDWCVGRDSGRGRYGAYAILVAAVAPLAFVLTIAGLLAATALLGI